MSEGKRKSGFEKVRNNLTKPVPTEDHIDAWAEETFDRLSNQTRHQQRRQSELKADLGELMDTFDELSDSYAN